MRIYLLLFSLCFIFFSCKKTSTEEMEGDSFRISILPVKTEGFNDFKIKGTLEIRAASGDIEYGVIVGKSASPTLANGVSYSIGGTRQTLDFVLPLSGLDTGVVYYVRAYAKHNSTIEYSANQVISKMSPSIYSVRDILSYEKPFEIYTNIPNIKANASVKVFLDNFPLGVMGFESDGLSSRIVAQVGSQIPLGSYRLTLSINNVAVVYQREVRLLSGGWEAVGDLPRPRNEAVKPEYFMSGDWIYMYKAIAGNIPWEVEFSKFNYKTKQLVGLTSLENHYRLHDPSIVLEGSLVHFIGGDLIGVERTDNKHGSKLHYVYNMESDTWKREADFPGSARMDAISSIVDHTIYFGMGSNLNYSESLDQFFYKDLWSYDLSSKVWKRLADFPQVKGRSLGASFNIGSKMYLTAGTANQSQVWGNEITKETWCYDTSNNSWTQKADYPGIGQIKFANFSIGNYGYVGLGESASYDSYGGRNFESRFYKYDPSVDKWSEISNIDQGIGDPLSLSNGNIAIVGAGVNSGSVFTKALFQFTP